MAENKLAEFRKLQELVEAFRASKAGGGKQVGSIVSTVTGNCLTVHFAPRVGKATTVEIDVATGHSLGTLRIPVRTLYVQLRKSVLAHYQEDAPEPVVLLEAVHKAVPNAEYRIMMFWLATVDLPVLFHHKEYAASFDSLFRNGVLRKGLWNQAMLGDTMMKAWPSRVFSEARVSQPLMRVSEAFNKVCVPNSHVLIEVWFTEGNLTFMVMDKGQFTEYRFAVDRIV